jgi:Kef-type K+ transport system membrane component KefB/nucleotide-binding universal stress UspA family protein
VPQVILKPLDGHSVFLLLVQLALLLFTARLGAEACKRMGLPTVVGELAAGLLLGPTGLGHFAPGIFTAIFPQEARQFHLLEVVGTLGMVLLLLLTGYETDIRLLRKLGRAALIASAMGMVFPFVTGAVLGLYMPDAYLANPDQRILFSLFLATAMAISAMPVIAKILMDLDLTRRNIGLVILSAGVVDDTAGWLILSVIAGAASHGEVRLGGLVVTLLLTGGFMVAMVLAIYPATRWLMGFARRRLRTSESDLVLLLVLTFLCAAATEWIGIHAVFGAFVCGTMLRQVPQLSGQTVHRLESFVGTLLAPVFFGIVGLKVNLWSLGSGSMLLLVLTVACLGKLIGCTVGSLWGGLRFWEGLSIAVAMNARGAMELVVATIGLSLGILNQPMFSIIVVVAIATSFMAPLGLRLTIRKVRMTEDESRRILADASKRFLDPRRVRVLLPSAGGPNAAGGALLAAGIARSSAQPVEVVHIKTPAGWRDRIARWLGKAPPEQEIAAQVETHRQLIMVGLPPSFRTVSHHSAVEAILEAGREGVDLIVLGGSRRGDDSLGGSIVEQVVARAPCHVAIIKAGDRAEPRPYENLLVPCDGGVFSRMGVEFAVQYAEATGARVTVALSPAGDARLAGKAAGNGEPRLAVPEELAQISGVFLTSEVRPYLLHVSSETELGAIEREAVRGKYDLVVLGVENRAVQHRLYFGHEAECVLRNDQLSTVIVIPHLAV